jgi:VWFA-related protein
MGQARFDRGLARQAAAIVVACVASVALLAQTTSQEPQAAATFATSAAAITVDAVVLDNAGQPVRGLSPNDFVILEDGHPQAVVGFEARELAIGSEASSSMSDTQRVATNTGAAERKGRIFALLVDDLGLTAITVQQLKPALARWIRERASPNDEITLLTTSGDVWWSDVMGRGREDLLAVLERVHGKKPPASPNAGSISEAEAQQIDVSEGSSPAAAAASRSQTGSAGQVGDMGPPIVGRSTSVVDRVTTRFLDAHICLLCTYCEPPEGPCNRMVQQVAHQVYSSWTRRAQVVLDALSRLARDFGAQSGRKSILFVSEDFLRDSAMDRSFRAATDACQRANASLYFTNARGLTGSSFYGLESNVAPRPGDIGAINTEEWVLATAGAEQLAEATGGAASRSNDLADGLERMALDSSAYYLLGYQPQQTPDGRWHRLEVKVSRPGVKVRARRGYLAGPPAAVVFAAEDKAKDRKDAKDLKRDLASTTLAGGERGGIPLRLALYLQGPDGVGGARVLVALEIDGRRVQTNKTSTGAAVSLDLSILAVQRDRPKVIPLAQALDITLKESSPADWWALFRDVRLPPGVAQVRVTLRDKATGAVGTVSQRVDVPDVDGPYLSTPLITDKTQPPALSGEPPRLVPTAHRHFPSKGALFCQYELFSFGGHMLPGVAQVHGGYTLQAADGRVIDLVTPTQITTDGTRVVRRLALPTESLEPGDYTLTLTVEDRLANRTLSARESFTLDPS